MMNEERNMDDLLIAYLLNELDDTRTRHVEEWISASDENQKEFEQISEVWSSSQNALDVDYNVNEAWGKVSNRIKTKTLWQNEWIRVAAAILVLFGMFTVIMNVSSTVEPTVLFSETEVVVDTLVDGSVILLNKNSSLSYTDNFNSNSREVTLDGEAFFDIERDTTKPFIIHLASSKVKVLGTSFNIKSDNEDELVSVYVKSGVVLFEYLSDSTDSTYLSITLRKGDKVTYNKVTKRLEEIEDSTASNLDMFWVNQELIFDGIQLGKVAEILETVYDVEITFTNEQSKNCLVTVSFQNAEIDQIIEVIATTFGLEVEQIDNEYILKGLSCEES